MILVTGGAGFIGANLVLDWFALHDEPVVNLDKLTYAGNLETLASLPDDSSYAFLEGDTDDSGMVNGLLAEHKPLGKGLPSYHRINCENDRQDCERRDTTEAHKLEAELCGTPAKTAEGGIRETKEWPLGDPNWFAHVQCGAHRERLRTQYA